MRGRSRKVLLDTPLVAAFDQWIADHVRDDARRISQLDEAAQQVERKRMPLTLASWRADARRFRRWADRGIHTVRDLVENFSSISPRSWSKAAWLLGMLEVKAVVPIWIQMWRRPDLYGKNLASFARVLGMIGGRRAQCCLLESAQRELQSAHPNIDRLADAVSGLRGARSSDSTSTHFEVLTTVLERCDLPDRLRGDAADVVALHAPKDRRTIAFRRAVSVAMKCLGDPSAEVRFWSIFALWSLEAKVAIPKLRRMAKYDKAMCPWMWPVNEEAKDALYFLETGKSLRPEAAERTGWPDNGSHPEDCSCAKCS